MGDKEDGEKPLYRGSRQGWRVLFEAISVYKGTTPSWKCYVPIAETVVFKDGNPTRWLYNDPKLGYVVKRPAKKMIGKEFYRHFGRLALTHPKNQFRNITCIRVGEGFRVTSQILSEKELKGMTDTETYSMTCVCLQQYIQCKGGIGTSYRHEYTLTESNSTIMQTYKVFDEKVVTAIETRVTNELKEANPDGPGDTPKIQRPQLGTTKVTGGRITKILDANCKELIRIIESARKCRVTRLVTEYLVDYDDQMWLSHSPELWTEPFRNDNPGNIKKFPSVMESLMDKQSLKCVGDFCNYEIEENFDDEDGKRKRRTSKDNYDIQPHRNSDLEPDCSTVYQLPYRTIILAREEKLNPQVWPKNDVEPKNFLAFLYGDETPDFAAISPIALTGEIPGALPVSRYYREVTVCENCYKIYTKLDRGREVAVEKMILDRSENRRQVVNVMKSATNRIDMMQPFMTMVKKANAAKDKCDNPDLSMPLLSSIDKDDDNSESRQDDTGPPSIKAAKTKARRTKENHDVNLNYPPPSPAVVLSSYLNKEGGKRRRRKGARSPSPGGYSPSFAEESRESLAFPTQPRGGRKAHKVPDLGKIEDFLGSNWIDSDEKLKQFLSAARIGE